jgi:hypothetical protein
MNVTVNQIRKEMTTLVQAHDMVNSFFWGDFHRAYNEKTQLYPLVCSYLSDGAVNTNMTQMQLVVIVCDKTFKGLENLNDTESDTVTVARHLYNVIRQSPRWNNLLRVNSSTLSKFYENTSDEVAGVILTMNVDIKQSRSLCDLPLDNYDFDGTFIGGGGDCEDVLIVNSDQTFTFSAASGTIVELPDAPVLVTDQDGNPLGGGNVPSVTGGVVEVTIEPCPPCENATYVLTLGGNAVDSGEIGSGQTEEIPIDDFIPPCEDATVQINGDQVATVASGGMVNIAVENESGTPLGTFDEETGVWVVPDCEDATAVLRDTDNNILSTTPIASGATENITAPDGTVTVNRDGVFFADVDVTSGGVASVNVPSSTGWVRNPDWLPLPEITAADNRFVGLFLVFENEYNQVGFSINGTAGWSANIDWGDGTSQVVSTNANQVKVYDYATISNPVKQYYDGRNYKQLFVDVTRLSGTINTFHSSITMPLNSSGTINFGDVALSFPNVTDFRLSGVNNNANFRILEKLRVLNHNITTGNFILSGLNALEFAEVKYDTPTTAILGLVDIGPCTAKPLDINLNSRNDVNTLMGNRFFLKKFGNFTAPAPTVNAQQLFFNDYVLEEVGNITLASATNVTRMFSQCRTLQKIGVIDIPNAQNISQIVDGCFLLQEFEIVSAANVTITTSAFANTGNLKRVILPGITVGFSVAQNALSAQALNDLFTSLGTASGSQTIIVTGNPGAATCDTTIATAKGYTVQIA